MPQARSRETVDLGNYPDLVVIILGLKLRSLKALPSFMDIGRGLSGLSRTPPDGLLANEPFLFGWNHVGIRQYWRDAASLEKFTKQAPHSGWWKSFLQDNRDCSFWHEIYNARGGVEGIYIDTPDRVGLGRFAPMRPAVGPYFSSKERLQRDAAQRASAPG